MRTKLALFVLILLCIISITAARAADPIKSIKYQKVTTLPHAVYTMKFSIYDAASAGNMVWSEEKSINLTNTFTITTFLGSVTPLDPALFSQQLWVQIEDCTGSCVLVGTRERLAMVPYAMASENGGVSSIFAGNGLTASGTTGDITLNVGAGNGIMVGANAVGVNTNVIQKRVTGTCPAGSAIRTIDVTGAVVTCEPITSLTGAVSITQSSSSPSLTAVNTATTGTTPAIEAESNSTSGSAVTILGISTPTTPGGFSTGVKGVSNGTGGLGIGVWGSHAGSGWGVYGTAPSGIGVVGSSTSGYGLFGTSDSGFGVYGVSSASYAGYFSGLTYFGGDSTLSGNLSLIGNLSLTGNVPRSVRVTPNPNSESAGNALTVTAGGATTGSTNQKGGDLVLAAGNGTGTGGSGDVRIQTAGASSTSGTVSDTVVDRRIIVAKAKPMTLAAPGFASLMSIQLTGIQTAGGRIYYMVRATDGGSQIATEEGVIQYLATANSITCTVQTADKLHLGTVNSGCTPGFFNPGNQPGVSVFDNVTFSSPAPIVEHEVYYEIENLSGSPIRLEP